MVIYNAATKELTAKTAPYADRASAEDRRTSEQSSTTASSPGRPGSSEPQTQTDRTIYFDLLPVELGDIKGYKIRFQLATVPGQTAFNETRRVVLKGVDGIVFVADSQWTMLPKNLESWQNLKDNLKSNEITFESIPVVVQYNKRDLADILAVDAMQEARGCRPTLRRGGGQRGPRRDRDLRISKPTFVDLLRRLQGRRAEEDAAAAASEMAHATISADVEAESLLNRESQPTPIPPQPVREPPALAPAPLVPPVSEMAPFDTTELAQGVDDDEPLESPTRSRSPKARAAQPGADDPDGGDPRRFAGPTPASRSSRSPRPMRSRSSSAGDGSVLPPVGATFPERPERRAPARAEASSPREARNDVRPEPRGLRGSSTSRRSRSASRRPPRASRPWRSGLRAWRRASAA
jgi:signal recognition particle receptor subunit beta